MEAIVIQILLAGASFVLAVIVAVGATRARNDEKFRLLNARVDDAARDCRARDEAIGKDMQAELDTVHKRINDTRENWVRRDDFKEAMARVEQASRDMTSEVSRLRHEQRNTGNVIAAIAAKLNVEDYATPRPGVLPPGED